MTGAEGCCGAFEVNILLVVVTANGDGLAAAGLELANPRAPVLFMKGDAVTF